MNEKKECMRYIDSLDYKADPWTTCRLRTRYCVEWYTKEAIKYKNVFLFLSIVNVVVPQISAIIALKGKCNVVSAILASLVSFSTALLALLNVKERWTTYRSAVAGIPFPKLSVYVLKCYYNIWRRRIGVFYRETRGKKLWRIKKFLLLLMVDRLM